MCARSQTSGLISAEWAVSTSASESGATSASVRSRVSVRSTAASMAARCTVAVTERNATGSGGRPEDSGARAPGPPPHLDHLAHGRRAPRDPGVERPHHELEAAGLELLELHDERVEAAALLVDEHDVAGPDALRGRALRPLLAARGGRDVDQRGLRLGHGRRRLGAVTDG